MILRDSSTTLGMTREGGLIVLPQPVFLFAIVTDNLHAELSTNKAMVLWKRKGMYRDYYQALDQKQSLVFQNKIKELLY